ncbi:MAG: tetratricopeptide repeat protein, partial [bacterium]|nr:tetratricopeptide repeat protein [bacterium]
PLSKVRCEADPAWDNVPVCSYSLPADHPGLPPGKTSFLNVGYRTSIAARVARKEESPPIERLSEEKARAARRRLAAIAALPVPQAIRGLLEAGAYAEHGLYADAIAAYRRTLALLPQETIRVTLGDLYLQVGLHRFAFARYQEALDRSDDPAVDAAATFGIGRLYAARRNHGEALCHFRKAERLYAQLGLDEEKAVAKQAAAAAEARPERPNDADR